MSGWKPRLVAIDVDGTLLDPETEILSDAVATAVRQVVNAGSQVVIATGRSRLGAWPVIEELGLREGVALCSNGAVKLDAATGDPLAVEAFDPAPVYRDLVVRLPGAIFATERIGTASLVTSWFQERELHGPQRLATADELTDQPVPRLIADWVRHHPDELRATMSGVVLPACTYTVDHSEPWVTVVPEGVTKGAALEKVRAELGIPAAETFAAGDAENDVAMLEWAAHSVAMGQAPETVRAAATEVTAPVWEDGLATALRRWFG